MTRDLNTGRSQSGNVQNERSNLNANAIDKNKKTQKSHGSDRDQTDHKSSDL